ncbi:MAG: PocR ligand-binding domain-containing protein [Desulfuromonadales bacterium]|nr:PocR ligand-binding domain-containing protein [Desulfuromonadales bacterium]
MTLPLRQLIDLTVVRPLMQTFSTTSGMPMAIIDREGKVLATSGWQRLCTFFHRRVPLSVRRCIESDTDFTGFHQNGHPPASGDHFESRCRNGLVHIGFPIVIEGEHLATLFLSQFFYAPPDLGYFRRQAQELGLEEAPYLAAVHEVPVLDRTRVEESLGFFSGFAKLLEKLGTEHLRRLAANRQLEASEKKFRSIFEGALDSIVLMAPDGRLLEANSQTSLNLRYPREELLRLTKYDIHFPAEHPRIREYIEQVMRDGSAMIETVQQRRDGSLLPVEISGRRVDLLGEPAILCLSRDITLRKEAEQGLKRALNEAEGAREKINAILTSVPDGLVVTDLSDQVILINQVAERLLQPPLSPDSTRYFDHLLVEKGLREQIVASRETGEERGPFEWKVGTGNGGGFRIVQARSTPVRAASGRLTGTITLLRDITHEREIDQIKDDFISTAAHELRTPLATIMGFTELLLRPNQDAFSPEEHREFLRTIYEKSEVLAAIIQDLLDLSRIRAGHLITLQKSPEDLVPLVAKAVGAYREVSRKHLFTLDLPDAPVNLLLDAGKIGQVLENLLSNAVKFSPSGGTITISGHRTDGAFQLTIADEGIGMDPKQLARIFEKFYRADASTTAASGLGLGMSIVKHIVEAHGGRIWVESEPGRGTRTHFTLPLEEVPE